MSSPAPEGGRGRGNVFTRKIGPLPMWQWFLIALAMVGVYVIFQYRKNNQANANANNTAAGTSTGGTTGAGQVPQFVNQTNTYVAPPMAQPPPPSGHARGAPAPHPIGPAQPLPSAKPQTGYIGQTLQAVNAALSQKGIPTYLVYVQGQNAPLNGAQATVPYTNSKVTAMTTTPAGAILTVSP